MRRCLGEDGDSTGIDPCLGCRTETELCPRSLLRKMIWIWRCPETGALSGRAMKPGLVTQSQTDPGTEFRPGHQGT